MNEANSLTAMALLAKFDMSMNKNASEESEDFLMIKKTATKALNNAGLLVFMKGEHGIDIKNSFTMKLSNLLE